MLDSGDITVSKKTLLHVSEGIYRTEGSALKELINNAFDAKARNVLVDTNYPQFDVLSCRDDGIGMSKEEFVRIVTGGIGDSPKANQKIRVKGDRPTIGKLGIGILAIAQVCRSFTIVSHHKKSKTAFRGKMIFRTDVDQVAQKEGNKGSYEVGKWVLENDLEYDADKNGVFIFTDDLRQSFVRRFRDDPHIQSESKNPLPFEYNRIMDLLYRKGKTKAISELGPYHELIWELSLLLPIPYQGDSIIHPDAINSNSVELRSEQSKTNLMRAEKGPLEFIASKQAELRGYDFSVFVDGIKLERPIQFPTPLTKNGKIQESQIFYFAYDGTVRKRKLAFTGYIFAQESAIFPRDLKGLQIRIKNVGIGTYDGSFLKYDKIESPRDNWLSGEIFIEEGLESSLNIDRDSFNENDEHYFVLREKIHNSLRTEVFPIVRSRQNTRNKKRKTAKHEKKTKDLMVKIEQLLNKYFPGFVVEFDYDESKSIIYDQDKLLIQIPRQITSGTDRKKKDSFSNSMLKTYEFFSSQLSDRSRLDQALKEFHKLIIG